jgi:pSer/pThr/pTyr-binding forkhead associated (FHA) protein
MPARFFCQTGEFAGSSFEIADEVLIGRNEDGVRLSADVVSGTHARIYHDAERGGYFLEDLGSRNGTKLDGMPVTTPVRLGTLHVVTFADQIDFIYHEGGKGARVEAPSSEVEHTRLEGFTPSLPPVAPASDSQTKRHDAYTPGALPGQKTPPPEEKKAGSQTVRIDAFTPGVPPSPGEEPSSDSAQETRLGDAFAPMPNLPGAGATAGSTPSEAAPVRFSLEVTKGGRGSVLFPLSEGENTVGRASNCAVSLDDKSVSRQHALLTVNNGLVTLQDLDSRNHTFLNGTQVGQEVEVPLGAVIRFGLDAEARLRRA